MNCTFFLDLLKYLALRSMFLFLIFCSQLSFGQQKPPSKNAKALGTITLSITTTSVSYEYYGTTFYNLVLGYGIFYNGAINIIPSGGIGPYSFLLISPSQYQSNGYFTGLGRGTYSFDITDATGQTIDTTITIQSVYPQPTLTLSNIVVPTTCTSSNGSFTLTGSGGTPPYSYSIDGGSTFVTTNVFSNLTQGYYPLLLA
jgi:hypothetical protein